MIKTMLIWLAISSGIFAAVVALDIHASGITPEEAVRENAAVALVIPVAALSGLLLAQFEQ